jgi:hypothetical protein
MSNLYDANGDIISIANCDGLDLKKVPKLSVAPRHFPPKRLFPNMVQYVPIQPPYDADTIRVLYVTHVPRFAPSK